MKNKITTAVLTLSLLISGCKTIAIKKYKMGKKFNFEKKAEFISYLNKQKFFNADQFLFPDSSGLVSFVTEKLQRDSSFIYIGTYLNDTTEVIKSLHLSENKSCKGRINNEVSAILGSERISTKKLQFSKSIASYHLRHLTNSSLFDPKEMKDKKTVFLVYSYSLGTYYNDMYEELEAIVNSHPENAKLLIVCIDPVYQLK